MTITAAVVGDSYTAGFTGTTTSQADAWFHYTLTGLGWAQGNVIANPGAGFVKAGDFGTLAQSLRDHPIPSSTNFVLLQGGLNDSLVDPATVPPAIADLLSVVHAQAPSAVPILVGMFVPLAQGMSANRLAVARAMGDASGIGSNRYLLANMCSFEVGPDGTHPTALGHHQIGDWVTWHLINGMSAGDRLRPIGLPYSV